jgi:hypothetical protein
MQYIITHPNNKHCIDQIRNDVRKELDRYEIKTIHTDVEKFRVVYSEQLKEKRVVEYIREKDRFVEHGYSDWEIYLGFTKPVYRAHFLLQEDGRR